MHPRPFLDTAYKALLDPVRQAVPELPEVGACRLPTPPSQFTNAPLLWPMTWGNVLWLLTWASSPR
jgi:hypothetical protein